MDTRGDPLVAEILYSGTRRTEQPRRRDRGRTSPLGAAPYGSPPDPCPTGGRSPRS